MNERTLSDQADPLLVDSACKRIQEATGCSGERAFDLLYGAARSQGGGLYELAQIILRARSVWPYLTALERYHA